MSSGTTIDIPASVLQQSNIGDAIILCMLGITLIAIIVGTFILMIKLIK